jgi:molybdenum cofactor guanylyltransferase
MMQWAQVAGYVLAGGGSTRFGRDKALVNFAGQPMLLRMREVLSSFLGEARVIASPGRYASIGVESTPDRWPGEGPLGGIITALIGSSQSEREIRWNLIVGCDMPFLTREWLTYMAERGQASAAEVVVPRSASGLEPLCACWRTSAAQKLQGAFEEGIRKVTDAMTRLETEVLNETHWKRFDGAGRLFWNMNTPADYDQVRRVSQAEQT